MNLKTSELPKNCMHCFYYDSTKLHGISCLRHIIHVSNVNSCDFFTIMLKYLNMVSLPVLVEYKQYYLYSYDIYVAKIRSKK